MPFKRPLGIVDHYHAVKNKENIPPSTAKPFELHPTWSRPEFGTRKREPSKGITDYMRQKLLDGWEQEHGKDVNTTEKQKFIAAMKRNIAAEWYHLKYGAPDHRETRAVKKAAHRYWEEALPDLRLRFEADVKQWETDVLDKLESAKSCIRAYKSKEKKLSNLVEDSRYRFRKHKLEDEISWAKRFAKDRDQQYMDLQRVSSLTLEKRALDLGIVWRSYDVVKKNEKKPAAKKAGRKTPTAGQRSQESTVPVRNVTTGTTEYGRSHTTPETVQKGRPPKRKRGPTQQEVNDQHAQRVQDEFKAVRSDDSDGVSDLDEVFGKPPPIKKRKTSPTSDGLPAEKGVARRVNRSEPLKKAAGKKNTSRQRNDKNSPVPTTSSDTSKSSSTNKKEQSSSPPMSTTSVSSKRKQPSFTDSKEPASKKQLLGHSGNGQRVLGSSYGSNNTDEDDSAYGSQSDTSRRPDRRWLHQRAPRSLSPKRKRVSESDSEESAAKKQALEVDGIQVPTSASNGLNLEDEKVELELKEMVDNLEAAESGMKRKMSVPKSRKNLSATMSPSASIPGEQRKPDSSDEEQALHKAQPSVTSSEPISESASTHSADTSSMCNNVEEQSIRDNQEDEEPDTANKGKEEEQAMEEGKEDGQNNDSSAPVAPDMGEMPSPALVAAPVVPKKKFSLKDYKAAHPKFVEKLKAQVEDKGETDGRQSKGDAPVEEFKPLF